MSLSPWSSAQRNLISYRASDVKQYLGYDWYDILSKMTYDDSLHPVDVNELVGYVKNLERRIGTECTEVEFAENKEKLKDLLTRYKNKGN